MKEKPLISIITVNLNNVEGLKKTMATVFEQTWQKFEYVVIDGGSEDGSKEFIESQSKKIDYWVSEKDSGIYNAMNKGIKAATGEYLLFLNSGDTLLDQRIIENNKKYLKASDLVCFNICVITKKLTVVKSAPAELLFSYFINDTLPHQSTFIKATLFKKIGLYDENLLIVSDWKFFLLCICRLNASYKKIDKTISNHILDGISAKPENWNKILQERKKVLDQEFPTFIKDYRKFQQDRDNLSKLKNAFVVKIFMRLGLAPKIKNKQLVDK